MDDHWDYGYGDILVVVRGRYEGTVGYYDDDEGDTRVVIYPGVPNLTPYIIVPLKNVRKSTEEEAAEWESTKNNDVERQRAVNEIRNKAARRG